MAVVGADAYRNRVAMTWTRTILLAALGLSQKGLWFYFALACHQLMAVNGIAGDRVSQPLLFIACTVSCL